MNKKTLYGIFAGVLLALTAPVTASETGGQYTFTVLRDGEPIGEHQAAFRKDGARIEIEEATDLKVRFAMIPVFSFEHERREVWENGRVVSISAKTDEDGEEFNISVRRNGHGYIREINGRVDHFEDSTKVLAFWNKDTTKYTSFFSVVEDKTFKARFVNLGWEKLSVAGEALDVEHYQMRGDEVRDLWFDRQGYIAKVKFQRRGSDIEYVRDQASPMKLD